MFDAVAGDPAMAAAAPPDRAAAAPVRVERLGPRPFMLVQWKQPARDAGVVDLAVQHWSGRRTVIAGVKWPHARPA